MLANQGDFEAAEQLARESLAFAAQSDFYPAHADALMDLAYVLELRGDRQAAALSIEEAIHFYTLKGNLAQLERAHAVLTDLRV